MNNEIEKALSFDSLAEAEKITGIDYHGNDGVIALGMLLGIEHGKQKAALLQANKDTCFRNNLEQQIEAIEDMGFKLLHCDNIPGTGDKWRIFWRNGVLLFCDSYFNDTSMNGGNAYFNYKGPRNGMRRGSNGYVGEIDGQPVWEGHVDIREGLRHTLDTMRESGELLSKWISCPFLWLLHYMDTNQAGYNYNAINAERIALLPIEVQEAIKGS